MSTTVFFCHGELWIQRQRRRDQPDLFCAWRPNVSQLLEDPEDVIAFACAKGSLPAHTLRDLRAWVGQTLEDADLADPPAQQQCGTVVH